MASLRFEDASASSDEDVEDETEFQQLMRHWQDERFSPELLPAQNELLDHMMDLIAQQAEYIEKARNDPRNTSIDSTRTALWELEIEQNKFLVRSYIRTRMAKIEKFTEHLLETPSGRTCLADYEVGYAERYRNLEKEHYQTSVSSHLNATTVNINARHSIKKPDLDQPVIAKARRTFNMLVGGTQLTYKKGSHHLQRHKVVRSALKNGDVRLV
ncbi:GINS complex, Sld5 component [Atractiella rhizophila]|nr:GINS complex, Sld5 component [Atractiella rhizophila]